MSERSRNTGRPLSPAALRMIRIAAAGKQPPWKAYQVATAAGYGGTVWSSIVNGRRPVRDSALIKLAKALGIEAAALLAAQSEAATVEAQAD